MRLFGITIPDNKRLEIGLTAVYGIGRTRAAAILRKAGISPAKKAAQVSSEEESKIRAVAETLKLEGNLRREIAANIRRLRDIKSYRGLRHAKRLPVRGQRTRVNSRTIRGNVRRTMGSGRKKAEKK